MAKNSENALLTYEEICGLGHFVGFSGINNQSGTYSGRWKENSHFVAINGMLFFYVNSIFSTPIPLFDTTQNGTAYVQIPREGSEPPFLDCIVKFNFMFGDSWAPTGIVNFTATAKSIENNRNINISDYNYAGWLFVQLES